jgi:hypothetical protein
MHRQGGDRAGDRNLGLQQNLATPPTLRQVADYEAIAFYPLATSGASTINAV